MTAHDSTVLPGRRRLRSPHASPRGGSAAKDDTKGKEPRCEPALLAWAACHHFEMVLAPWLLRRLAGAPVGSDRSATIPMGRCRYRLLVATSIDFLSASRSRSNLASRESIPSADSSRADRRSQSTVARFASMSRIAASKLALALGSAFCALTFRPSILPSSALTAFCVFVCKLLRTSRSFWFAVRIVSSETL